MQQQIKHSENKPQIIKGVDMHFFLLRGHAIFVRVKTSWSMQYVANRLEFSSYKENITSEKLANW